MKKDLSRMTDSDLRDLFKSLCIQQGKAFNPEGLPRYKRLYFEIKNVAEEMKRRPGDARHLLVPLLTHEDWQVRLKAGTYTYAIAPQQARQALQWLAETRLGQFGLDAGFFLAGIDKGEFTPT